MKTEKTEIITQSDNNNIDIATPILLYIDPNYTFIALHNCVSMLYGFGGARKSSRMGIRSLVSEILCNVSTTNLFVELKPIKDDERKEMRKNDTNKILRVSSAIRCLIDRCWRV